MSLSELLWAARIKAEQEGFLDASTVLNKIASNPIEEGESIKQAMNTVKTDGKFSNHLVPCKGFGCVLNTVLSQNMIAFVPSICVY